MLKSPSPSRRGPAAHDTPSRAADPEGSHRLVMRIEAGRPIAHVAAQAKDSKRGAGRRVDRTHIHTACYDQPPAAGVHARVTNVMASCTSPVCYGHLRGRVFLGQV